MNSVQNLIDTLKTAGCRITPQRRRICAYLVSHDTHPTAAMIYDELKEEMPSLSLMTVYNTLNTLSDLGAIHVIGQAGDDTVHYDADIDPHINVICVNCHTIMDIPSDYLVEIRQEIDEQSGFKLIGARMSFYGLCPDCQAKAEKESGT